MARQLRRLFVGLALGALAGWFWLRRGANPLGRRQEHAVALDTLPATPPPGSDERIVLPTWSAAAPVAEESPVSGRIVLPDGKEATSVSVVPNGVAPIEAAPSPAADVTPTEVAAPIVETPTAEVAPPRAEVTTVDTVVETPAPGVTSEGYCVRCKEQRPMVNVRHVVTANKRPALKGECAVCGAGMFKFSKE